MPGLCIVLQEPGHLLEDVQIQIHDAARGFQNGNELVGVDHGAVRLDPAGQRLGSDDREIFGRELGLEVQFEFAVFKRCGRPLSSSPVRVCLTSSFLSNWTADTRVLLRTCLRAKFALSMAADALRQPLNGVHTHPYPQAYLRVMLGLILLKPAAERVCIMERAFLVTAGEVEHELVAHHPAQVALAPVAGRLDEEITEFLQQLITGGVAVFLVEIFEVLEVAVEDLVASA